MRTGAAWVSELVWDLCLFVTFKTKKSLPNLCLLNVHDKNLTSFISVKLSHQADTSHYRISLSGGRHGIWRLCRRGMCGIQLLILLTPPVSDLIGVEGLIKCALQKLKIQCRVDARTIAFHALIVIACGQVGVVSWSTTQTNSDERSFLLAT